MSTPTTPYTNAELAELFTLLTSAGSRSTTSDKDASTDSIPILKRLSQTFDERDAGARRRRNRNAVASVLSQKDTNTEDTTMADGESDTETDASLADFSRADAKKFVFAFKHPIHKLYHKADWAKTVLDTIEASRHKYKPLAEQVVYAGAKGDQENAAPVGKDDGAVRFKIPASPVAGRARRSSVVSGRKRSSSTARGSSSINAATAPHSPGSAALYHRSAYPKSPSVNERPEVRALKKRCIGRRKSMNGLQSQGEGNSRGAWVYDAAVSATERPVRENFAAFPPGPPASPTGEFGRSKYGVLGTKNMPSTLQDVTGLKRRVSASGPGMVKPLLMPLNQVTGKDRLVTRRRAMEVDWEHEGCEAIERNTAKRAFMV
ncbi:hypothetical protein BJ912DRAFT_974761 [Pholiota molesta]|nr:hypothetical protein BJ912DRAFT_974761 [Pholiota molesta]